MKQLLIFLTSICYSISATTQSLPDSTVQLLKIGVKGFMDRYHSPSLVVTVVHKDSIVFSDARGFADLEKQIPATIDYRYPVLSLTKVFTATMYMQLKQQGKLKLEDDVSEYIPEFTNGGRKAGTEISLLQLATHTSGLARNTHADLKFSKQIDKWIFNRESLSALDPASKAELLKSLAFIRPEYPPYKFLSYNDRLYSNLGYSMLGIAVERAAKMDFAEYIRKNIFIPIGMASSGFDSEKVMPAIARGYYYDDSTKTFDPTPTFHSNGALYAGGMYSTARDLAKFISFQFDTSRQADNILSVSNRAMMSSLRIGWKPDYPVFFHEGSMLGYRCIIVINPGLKLGWIFLTNTSEFDFARINRYFTDLLSPIYTRTQDPKLQDFAGSYILEDGRDSITITYKDGQLISDYLLGEISNNSLVRTGKLNFNVPSRGSYKIHYDFISDESGKIKYLNLGQLKWKKR